MEFDAVIIGSGIGGLFAAFNLSQEGKKVLVLESQPVIGGYATTFMRKGFTFESCLHCVGALGKEGEIRKYLEATGVAKELEFIEPQEYCRCIYPEHDCMMDFSGAGRTGSLMRQFPGQEKNIENFFKAVEQFTREFDRFSDLHLPDYCLPLAMPLFFRNIMRASSLTAQEFIARYTRDEKLISVLTDFWTFTGTPPGRLSALYFLLMFAGYHFGAVAQVKGGFNRVLDAMAARIKASGGQVAVNSKVARIITHKGRKVAGVVTQRQEEFKAKTVISNANALDTLGEYIDDEAIKSKYRATLGTLEKSISAFQVYLGLKVPAKSLGMTHPLLSINPSYDHEAHYACALQGDFERCPLILTDHARLDPSLVPSGKGSLLIVAFDLYSRWKGLGGDAYRAKKQAHAAYLIKRAEKFLPGLASSIEVMEAASPLTMERYTGSPQGAMYGFTQTLGQAGNKRLAQDTGIKGLFLAGAWTFPGGGAYGCFASGMIASELALSYLKRA